jgi:hypothetical protein
MPKKFRGQIVDGKLNFPLMQDELRRQCLTSWEGKQIVETITIWRPGKSHQQVKAIFGLALSTIKHEFDDRGWDTSMLLRIDTPTGIEVSIEILKAYLYAACPIFDDHGDAITLSNKNCDTTRAAKFFTDITAFAASQWAIYIPDPDPNWRNHEE